MPEIDSPQAQGFDSSRVEKHVRTSYAQQGVRDALV